MAKMHILYRISRHVFPATTPEELADYRDPNVHLLWQGQFKPKNHTEASSVVIPARSQYLKARTHRRSALVPRPYLNGPNCNPVRVLFDYPHVLDLQVHLSNQCGHRDCINPCCYRATAVNSKKFSRTGTIPSHRIIKTTFDELNVRAILDDINDPDIEAFSDPLDWAEAVRRSGVLSLTAGGTAAG